MDNIINQRKIPQKANQLSINIGGDDLYWCEELNRDLKKKKRVYFETNELNFQEEEVNRRISPYNIESMTIYEKSMFQKQLKDERIKTIQTEQEK